MCLRFPEGDDKRVWERCSTQGHNSSSGLDDFSGSRSLTHHKQSKFKKKEKHFEIHGNLTVEKDTEMRAYR